MLGIMLALMGGLLGGLGRGVRFGLLAICLAVVALCVVVGGLSRLPQRRAQVPLRSVQAHPTWGPFQFGLELGSGIRTHVNSSAPYAVVLAVVLLAPSGFAPLLAGLSFGTVRGLYLLVPARMSVVRGVSGLARVGAIGAWVLAIALLGQGALA
jgi:hypothetical protein